MHPHPSEINTDPGEIAAFALFLHDLPGIGVATANRLLRHFKTYAYLKRYPQEQILVRLEKLPHARRTVKALLDTEEASRRLENARKEVQALAQKKIEILTPLHANYPSNWQSLPESQRPYMLLAFGHLEILNRKKTGFFAHPPLSSPVFEAAQSLMQEALHEHQTLISDLKHGFDVVLHKRASASPTGASIALLDCGFSYLPPPMRPHAMTLVRRGGLLLSPYPIQQPPAPYQSYRRIALQMSLADALVFLEPQPEKPYWKSFLQALEQPKPTTVLGNAPVELPTSIRHFSL